MSVRIRIKFKLGNNMSIIDLDKRKTPPGGEVFALSKENPVAPTLQPVLPSLPK